MEALREPPRRPTQKPCGRLKCRRPTQPLRGRHGTWRRPTRYLAPADTPPGAGRHGTWRRPTSTPSRGRRAHPAGRLTAADTDPVRFNALFKTSKKSQLLFFWYDTIWNRLKHSWFNIAKMAEDHQAAPSAGSRNAAARLRGAPRRRRLCGYWVAWPKTMDGTNFFKWWYSSI